MVVINKGTEVLENILKELNGMNDSEIWNEYKRLEKKVENWKSVKIIIDDFTMNKDLYNTMSNKSSLKESIFNKISEINANRKLYNESDNNIEEFRLVS